MNWHIKTRRLTCARRDPAHGPVDLTREPAAICGTFPPASSRVAVRLFPPKMVTFRLPYHRLSRLVKAAAQRQLGRRDKRCTAASGIVADREVRQPLQADRRVCELCWTVFGNAGSVVHSLCTLTYWRHCCSCRIIHM